VSKSILLIVAFSALLVVIGGSSAAVWLDARNAQERVAALHKAHMEAGAALSSIRANVYLNGILTRDYLLDFDPSNTVQYVAQFNAMQANTERGFRILEAAGQDAAQKAVVARLRSELSAYWDMTGLILDWSSAEKGAQRNVMLRQRVRRRQEVFALAAQVERLMADNYSREQQRITSAESDFRVSVGWTAGIALLFGLAIAGTTLMRMLNLERQSQAAALELRRLTGKIRTAQEQERKLLSRELHDQVGQMLTGVRMELAYLARMHGDSESELSSRIAQAKDTVEQTLRIVRNTAMLLRPSMLDDFGLTPALAWLVKEVSRSSGVEIHSEVDAAVDTLPEAHRTCIYRVVQEALTNVSRHSGAHSAEVTLKSAGGWVAGAIVDDGHGFETGSARNGGLGLVGIKERVAELGGTFRVKSAPGSGTRVEFRLPCPPATEVSSDTNPDRGRSRDRSDRAETSA
jgi:signal transduction histidine kinase